LTSVVIPPGVTTIGKEAFSKNQLTRVELSPGVTTIGQGAFNNNKLTSVVIPPGVTTIGKAAFSKNQLASVVIPPTVTNIGDLAFADNEQLTSITIGVDVKLSDVNVEFWENKGPAFPKNFDDFYNRKGKKAGTYTWRKGLLGYGWTYSP
jgi:hypothetical protein